ncbi:hypothetical protein ACFWBN_28170 [Streptomyces sp. NPDC059989]|uniref:hypothetical protein n=1 Tax=Streptomyces sp. NPDC059989 TaxID=3347026 RepID=UPI00367B1029
MPCRWVRSVAAPALLSLPLLLAGCSGGDSGSGSASAPASAQPSALVSGEPSGAPSRLPKGTVLPEMAAYFQCLKDKGLPMKDTPSGIPVVDDSADPDKVKEADRACESLVPVAPVSAEQHAEARDFTACMRANGIAEFPDPDPRTARHDYEHLDLKGSREGVDALQACGNRGRVQ